MQHPAPQERGPRGSAGARRRRKALYAPPPRLTRTTPLEGRLLWHIGDWGRASEHIGARWEEVAAAVVRERLEPGCYLVVLGATPALMAEVLSTGLPHADALRAWSEDGLLALEPLDFKWSLETASVRQVSGETLARLLEAQPPRLTAELAAARAALSLAADAAVSIHDGRFLAPEHPANRAALRLDPELPGVLLPVDAQEFFQPLPGWPAARALARMEGVDCGRLRSVEAVERYYRLGAGVAGALGRLRAGLFEVEPPAVDAEREVELMRQSAPTINALLLELERELARRRALDERLAQLPRAAYPFGRLRVELARLQAPRSLLESRGGLGRLYGEVTREVAEAIRAEGAALVAQGLSEEEALARLEAQPERWAALAANQARHLAASTWTPRG